MLYTVELDSASGLVDLDAFDVSAFAGALERHGALDAVTSVGEDGSIGFTAQIGGFDIIDATELAIKIGGTAYGNYFPIESVRVYLTPVLDEIEAA